MKSYIDITGKYLRMQKKRSILTVVGIILSVALVTGIGTIFTSMYDAQIRSTIKSDGDYYAAISGVPVNKVELFSGNVETDKAGITDNMFFSAYAPNEKNDTDPPYKYLQIKAMDKTAMSMLPYTLKEGRMPAADGEIVLDYWTLKYMPGIQIGSTVSLDIGTRTMPDGTVAKDTVYDSNEKFTKTETRKYSVVGLLKPGYISTTNFAKAIAYKDITKMVKTDTCTVILKLKTNSDIQSRVKRMVAAAGLKATTGGDVKISFNERLLRLYAQSLNEMMNDSLVIILSVIVGLVVLSTIAVIYNAFNISVVERVSQFGLLRCVGATPPQIRKIVFREAFLLGVIGIPIGVISGIGAMGIVFNVISIIAPDMILGGLRVVVSPILIAVSVVIGAITIYLSAVLPARKAAKISPMEAVRGTGIIKKEKYHKTDKRRIVLKLLGAEGWMAWKNLGRNRKRFYITVFSMVISIVLFIVFSSLVGFAFQSGAVDASDMPSFMLYPANNRDKLAMSSQEMARLAAMNGVDYVLAYGDTYAEVKLPQNKLNARVSELSSNPLEKDAQGNIKLVNNTIVCYTGDAVGILMRSMQLGGFDAEAFNQGRGIIVINGGMLFDEKKRTSVLADITTLRAGDSIEVNAPEFSGDTTIDHKKVVNILSVVEKGLPGYSRNQNGGVTIIMSEKLLHEISPKTIVPRNLMVMMKQGSDASQVQTYVNSYVDQNPNMNLVDMDASAKNSKQTMIVMSIFLYGFVVVISIIGCLNIINTISTNIIIRTRELSVMRAVGMGDGSVRRMVAWESIFHGITAALVGSVIGSALSWLLYNQMVSVREFPWAFPWQQILIAVGAASLIAVISGIVPLKRINKGVIIEGIRGEE